MSLSVLELIGRKETLFSSDLSVYERHLQSLIKDSRFLVVGGAGSIGQAVTLEIFRRGPDVLHVVDISENNMVELVRRLRSTQGYIEGDFRTFIIDCGSPDFTAFMSVEGPYDYVLNLSALKHVRSEEDPFTLMRMVEVNILNTIKTVDLVQGNSTKKYFCVSTDKAANPVNMMGASKRIMEMFLMRMSIQQDISTSRFANVAFSDGSLLYGFKRRFANQQPISAPIDVSRYFITPEESGELCLMSCLLGENRDIFFPKLSEKLPLVKFSDIATRYLLALGYEPHNCETEDEARERAEELIAQRKWPCHFFRSDTTGEKEVEEFYTEEEEVDVSRYAGVGVIHSLLEFDDCKLDDFISGIQSLRAQPFWTKEQILDLFLACLPKFAHKETGKYLDQRM